MCRVRVEFGVEEVVATIVVSLVVAGGVAMGLDALVIGRHGEPDATRCPRCRYSLVGLGENARCPECGLIAPLEGAYAYPRVRYTNIGVILTIGLIGGALACAYASIIGPCWAMLYRLDGWPWEIASRFVGGGREAPMGGLLLGVLACAACGLLRTGRPVRRVVIAAELGIITMIGSIVMHWLRGDIAPPEVWTWMPLWCVSVVAAHALTCERDPEGSG